MAFTDECERWKGLHSRYRKADTDRGGFRDLKRVMHWEAYTARVPKAEYMEKCIGISSLSYAMQVSLGRHEAVGKVEERCRGWLVRWRNAMLRGVRYVSELLGAFVAAICMNIWRVEHSFP